jgi:hypothetical protein
MAHVSARRRPVRRVPSSPWPYPDQRHPVTSYLTRFSLLSRRTMVTALHTAVHLLQPDADRPMRHHPDPSQSRRWPECLLVKQFACHRLDYSQIRALRNHLIQRYAPATANRILTGVRGVLDTPPALTEMIRAAIAMADFVLIPARPSPHDFQAVGVIVEIAETIGKPFGFVVNGATPRTTIALEAVRAAAWQGGTRHLAPMHRLCLEHGRRSHRGGTQRTAPLRCGGCIAQQRDGVTGQGVRGSVPLRESGQFPTGEKEVLAMCEMHPLLLNRAEEDRPHRE